MNDNVEINDIYFSSMKAMLCHPNDFCVFLVSPNSLVSSINSDTLVQYFTFSLAIYPMI